MNDTKDGNIFTIYLKKVFSRKTSKPKCEARNIHGSLGGGGGGDGIFTMMATINGQCTH